MLHKYRKTALIEAEQFDGSDEMIRKYHIKYYSPGDEYSFYTKEGDSILNMVITSLLALMESIGLSTKIFLNGLMRGATR